MQTKAIKEYDFSPWKLPKFNEKVEIYQIFPPNGGWQIGKGVFQQCCESIMWCNFLKDNMILSNKFINT